MLVINCVNYQIEFIKGASKQLKKLPTDIKEWIDTKIQELAIEPHPNGVKKLQDDDLYRILVSDYRIIYQIDDDIVLVTIVKVKHRQEVYRDESLRNTFTKLIKIICNILSLFFWDFTWLFWLFFLGW